MVLFVKNCSSSANSQSNAGKVVVQAAFRPQKGSKHWTNNLFLFLFQYVIIRTGLQKGGFSAGDAFFCPAHMIGDTTIEKEKGVLDES